jgi:hypothetical protein
MITPLNPIFQKRINDAFDNLVRTQVEPWAMLNSGKPMRVKTFNNKQISYEVICFEGSPEKVFWSRYIEPFIEEIVTQELAYAVRLAAEKRVNGNHLLKEVRGFLLAKSNSTYIRMAEIDRRLKGKGFPEKIPQRSIEAEFNKMKNFIDLRVRAEKEVWYRSRFERWFKQNKFWVWVVGAIGTLAGVYAIFK